MSGPDGEAHHAPVERTTGAYILVRLAVGLALLAVTALSMDRDRFAPLHAGIEYGLAAVLFGTMGVSAALLPRYGRRPWFPWSQVSIDAVFVTALVMATGGAVSPYFPLYFMNIVASAWLLPSWGTVAVATLDAAAFVVVLASPAQGFVGESFGGDRLLAYTHVLMNLFGFFLVGLLSGQLSQKLRTARVALARQVEERQQLQVRHETVLDSMDSGVLLVDREGVVRDLNPAAAWVLGQVKDRRLAEILSPRGRGWEQSIERNGYPVHLLCSKSQLPDGGEVVLVEDVTVLRQMEAAVAREERLAAVGRLAAALAHEIRNPLASLSGSIQMLGEEHPSPLHPIMLREVRRLDDLVEQFLFSARPIELKLEPSDPVQVVEEVVTAFRTDERYRDRSLELAVEGDVPTAMLDVARVRQAIWNLVINAGQATHPGGRIRVRAVGRGQGIAISVRDNGEGIPPERIERIFDPFHTTRSGGTGLGLANVERVAHAHGGQVTVASKPGEGSEFTLWFPLAPRQGRETEPRTGAGGPAGRRPT